MDTEPQVSWKGAVMTGLVIGVPGPLVLVVGEAAKPGWQGWGGGLAAILSGVIAGATAGVAAACMARGLGLGRRQTWDADTPLRYGARVMLTVLRYAAGWLLGIGAGILGWVIAWPLTVVLEKEAGGDLGGMICFAVVGGSAVVTALLCPLLWAGWLARMRKRQQTPTIG